MLAADLNTLICSWMWNVKWERRIESCNVDLVATHRHQACQVFLAPDPPSGVRMYSPSPCLHKNPIFVIKKNKSHAIQLPWGHLQGPESESHLIRALPLVSAACLIMSLPFPFNGGINTWDQRKYIHWEKHYQNKRNLETNPEKP